MTEHHIIGYYSYIRYLLSNGFIFNAVLSLEHRLPKDLLGIRFVDFILKPHYISHTISMIAL